MKKTLFGVLSALAVTLTASAQSTNATNFALDSADLRDNGATAPYENLLRAPALLGLSVAPGGAVYPNLRSLGLGNTLVLINGRRAFNFSNLNALPLAALARVDVMKDGLGAVYGDGAAGGVLNFVTLNGPGERKFVGTEIDLVFGFAGKKGGDFRAGSFTSGFANEKIAIVASASYSSQDRFSLPVAGVSSPRVERKQFFAGFEAPVAGRSARIYGDVLATNTRVGAGSVYSPLAGGYFETRPFDARSTRVTAGVRGELGRGTPLSGISYDIGAAVEDTRVRGR